MTSYATALEVQYRRKRTFGGDKREPYVPAGGAHAVLWPDPEGRDWEDTETLCGRSTEYMQLEEHHESTEDWPRASRRGEACRRCAAEMD